MKERFHYKRKTISKELNSKDAGKEEFLPYKIRGARGKNKKKEADFPAVGGNLIGFRTII